MSLIGSSDDVVGVREPSTQFASEAKAKGRHQEKKTAKLSKIFIEC